MIRVRYCVPLVYYSEDIANFTIQQWRAVVMIKVHYHVPLVFYGEFPTGKEARGAD